MIFLKYATVFSLFNICLVNIPSARNKLGDKNDAMNNSGLPYIVFTEFWMEPNDADNHLQLSNLDTDKHNTLNHPCPKKAGEEGAWIATIARTFRNKYNFRQDYVSFSAKTFEYAVFNVQGIYSVVALY